MSLMYNNNTDRKIHKDDLYDLPEPVSLGRFHKPYPFAEFVDDIHSALRMNEVVVTHEEYVIQKDEQRLFGMMAIGQPDDGWQLTLGIRGSHDQSVPRGIAIGTNVLVCSNLCFDGELFTGKAKQTVHNSDRIMQMIHDGIATIPEARREQEEIFHAYKTTDLFKKDADALLLEAFRRGALSGSQLGTAVKEYDKPSYAEHGQDGELWRLFNAMTQAVKPNGQTANMNTVVRRTQAISRMLNEYLRKGDLI